MIDSYIKIWLLPLQCSTNLFMWHPTVPKTHRPRGPGYPTRSRLGQPSVKFCLLTCSSAFSCFFTSCQGFGIVIVTHDVLHGVQAVAQVVHRLFVDRNWNKWNCCLKFFAFHSVYGELLI